MSGPRDLVGEVITLAIAAGQGFDLCAAGEPTLVTRLQRLGWSQPDAHRFIGEFRRRLHVATFGAGYHS